jgi:hypothetical protein
LNSAKEFRTKLHETLLISDELNLLLFDLKRLFDEW